MNNVVDMIQRLCIIVIMGVIVNQLSHIYTEIKNLEGDMTIIEEYIKK